MTRFERINGGGRPVTAPRGDPGRVTTSGDQLQGDDPFTADRSPDRHRSDSGQRSVGADPELVDDAVPASLDVQVLPVAGGRSIHGAWVGPRLTGEAECAIRRVGVLRDGSSPGTRRRRRTLAPARPSRSRPDRSQQH